MGSDRNEHELNALDAVFLPVPAQDDLVPVGPPPGHTMQQIKGSYSTAVSVQVHRETRMAEIERMLLSEARLAGEGFYYGWGAGKDRVEGPSQELTFALARCWGNCAVESGQIQDLPDCWIMPSTFVDLETGFTLTRVFRQSKRWTVYGKFDDERKDDIRFQIGQSKAARNVILKALPEWLVKRAIATAKQGVREKLEKFVKEKGIAAAQELLVKELGKRGIRPQQIAAKCSVADAKALTIEHLVMLRGDLSAIDSGQDLPETLFPPLDGPQGAQGETKEEDIKARMKARRASKAASDDEAAGDAAEAEVAAGPSGTTPEQGELQDSPSEPGQLQGF